MLYGRYEAVLGNYKVNALPTYSTISTGNLTGVFSDLSDRPPFFAAVGTSTVEWCEKREASLTEIFGALSDREVLRIIKKLSESTQNDSSYDKPSFCLAFGVKEADFERLLSCLATLNLITERTVTFDDRAVTVYHPSLNNAIVLMLSLSDLLYNASPDGSVH